MLLNENIKVEHFGVRPEVFRLKKILLLKNQNKKKKKTPKNKEKKSFRNEFFFLFCEYPWLFVFVGLHT